MNTTIWVLQGLMAFVFLFSGFNKAYYDEKTLVLKGQTGVEGLSSSLIKFIGISEIFGAVGLIVPWAMGYWTILTPIAAIFLGIIMVPAAYIHYKNKETRNVILNITILLICIIIALNRFN